MEELSLTTPSLLFPAISLLMLAFTNRFLALSSLVRSLSSDYKDHPEEKIIIQLKQLHHRLRLIRNMQWAGVVSLFLCVLSMFLLFQGQKLIAGYLFMAALVFLMASLAISLREIQISINALKTELSDLEAFKDIIKIKRKPEQENQAGL